MKATIDRSGEGTGLREAPDERDLDFARLYRDLVEEADRALEAGEEGWCALLQGVLIPSVEREGLRAVAALRGDVPGDFDAPPAEGVASALMMAEAAGTEANRKLGPERR